MAAGRAWPKRNKVITVPTQTAYQRTLLETTTYDGSGQATHPSVIAPSGGWNGWPYWMAMTPLPGNDEDYEDPSILVSLNGREWRVPPTLSNPVVSVVGAGTSDPELYLYDGTAYLFWRESGGVNPDTIHVATSTDGPVWTGDTTILSDADASSLLSPAVVRDSDGTWRLWAIDASVSPNVLRMWTATDPLGTWTGPSACTATDPQGRDLWHCSVVWDAGSSRYRMFLTTCSSGNSGDAARLLLGTSSDATTWAFSTAKLSPASTGFDNYTTGYHASGVLEGGRWRVWYGGQNSDADWRIGYTEAASADFP